MEVKEVKKKQQELQENLQQLINDFQKETGVREVKVYVDKQEHLGTPPFHYVYVESRI